MEMFELLKRVLFDWRWKMSERHRKCLTWLIMSVQRSWGKQRVAARRTTAVSLCCAAGGRETLWVMLISSVEKCIHCPKGKFSYFADVTWHRLFIAMVLWVFCVHPPPYFVTILSHLIPAVMSLVDFLLHLSQDWWIWFYVTHPALTAVIGWAVLFFSFCKGLICRILLVCQRMSSSRIIPAETLSHAPPCVCHWTLQQEDDDGVTYKTQNYLKSLQHAANQSDLLQSEWHHTGLHSTADMSLFASASFGFQGGGYSLFIYVLCCA